MTTVRVNVTGIDGIADLAADLAAVPRKVERGAAKVAERNAKLGNKIAKANASRQHTMGTAIDVPYQDSFSAEQVGAMAWEYGPVDDGIKHGGSQATGYEFGSRNQAPHSNLDRSVDVIGPKIAEDVDEMLDEVFWP